ncbi:MAG: hypothetical protein ABFC88_07895 [Thermoguttaceae bacterium]
MRAETTPSGNKTTRKRAMENLQEFVSNRGSTLRVNRTDGVIRGVRIIGLESSNGRRYLPEALQRAIPLYESAKVNVNHPSGNPAASRDYRDRLGVIRNVSADAGGLRGDLHYNPKHALAEQLAWDAEHAPENVGFSHNVEAKTSAKNGRVIVEAITRVISVDLVADPATTQGLFEHHEPIKAESVPVVENAADFVAIITDRPTAAEQRAANEALGLSDREGVEDFARTVTGRPMPTETKQFLDEITE